MDIDDMKEILQDTLEISITELTTVDGCPAESSKDIFNPILFSYEGRVKTSDGDTLRWSMTRDEEGWEVTAFPA